MDDYDYRVASLFTRYLTAKGIIPYSYTGCSLVEGIFKTNLSRLTWKAAEKINYRFLQMTDIINKLDY